MGDSNPLLFHKIYKSQKDDTAVVILHGLFGTLDNWHNIARKLSEDRTVITVDQRNHGKSFHSDEMSYAEMAHDLEQLLDELGLHKVHLIGHSMGGKVAMEFGQLHPSYIERMVIVDIAPKQYEPGHNPLFKAMFDLDITNLKSRKEADEALKENIPHDAIRLFLMKNLVRNESGGYRWKINLKVLFDNYDHLIEGIDINWPFSSPTLFLSGEFSDYITPEDESHLGDSFPQAEFVCIEHAGHWVHADQPSRFLEEVASFLK